MQRELGFNVISVIVLCVVVSIKCFSVIVFSVVSIIVCT